MRKKIYLLIISVILFSSGFVNYYVIQSLIVDHFSKVSFAYEKVGTQFFDSLVFGIICGIIPIVLTILWSKTFTEKKSLKFISLLVLIIVIALYNIARIEVLKSKYDSNTNSKITSSISFENINIPLHIFLGELLGFLIIYIVLKRIKLK